MASVIKIGGVDYSGIRLGDKVIDAVYRGADLIFQADSGAPVALSEPSLTGIGYAGRDITITPGNWDKGTAAGILYADGNAIDPAEIVGNVFTGTAATHGAALKYVETNGGVTAESNVIHHKTVAEVGVPAHYDWTDASYYTETASKLVTSTDLSGNGGDITQLAGAKQADVGAGFAELSTTTQMGIAPAVSSGGIIAVCRYSDGVDAGFDKYATLMKAGSLQVRGRPNDSILDLSQTAVINGGAESGSILPLQKSIVRVAAPSSGEAIAVLHSEAHTDRAFAGGAWAFVVYRDDNTESELQEIEGILAHSHSVTLDAAHPHYSSPPTV